MNYSTCSDLAVPKLVAERMEPQMPWLANAIKVGLIWHLSVVHGVSYQDVALNQAARPFESWSRKCRLSKIQAGNHNRLRAML